MAERPASRDPFELCGTTIVAKYRITELVGSGGFGVVYRGEHLDLGEPVAVKCLKSPPELAPEEQKRLLAVLTGEAKTLHKLCGLTSNIVRLLDVGATHSRGQWVPYLVLEWLEGETLNEHLRARAEQKLRGMPLAQAVDLLEPAARALGVAHRQKVAHRDVKPDNLFLTQVGGKPVLKVLDFGIAKTMADASYTAAQNATMKQPSAFTPSYGAPEQFNKKRGPTGAWTDVFALALILVEVVSGERALDGDDATQLYIAAADPAARPTLRHRGIETTDLVEAVLRRALAIDPQDRYPDADTFWDALRDAMAGRSTQTPRVDVSETGEFVTRHAIDVDVRPGATREPPTAVEGARPARAAKEAPVAEPTERSAGAPSVSSAVTKELGVRVVESANDDETGKATVGSAPTALDAGGAHDERARAPGPAPASAGKSRPDETLLAAGASRKAAASARAAGRGGAPARARRDETVEPPSEQADAPPSSAPRRFRVPWTLLVVVAALAGATLLYLELQYGNRPSTGGSGRSSQVTESARPTTSPASSTSPTTNGAPTSASTAPPDAGTDAAVDASVDGGKEGGAPVVAPAGMVYVPPPEADAGPGAHGYFIDRTEVTVKDYRACVKAGSCEPATEVTLLEPLPGVLDNVAFAPGWTEVCNDKRGALEHPANCVKHSEARAYCRFVQKRLPTAAEYRLAAAGVQAFEFPWGGETPSCERACFGLNNQASCLAADAKPATCEVGTKQDESPYGALDLAGNVTEWVEGVDEGIDGGAPHALVFGGSFADEAAELKTTRMLSLPAVTKFPTIGFRCAKPAPPIQ